MRTAATAPPPEGMMTTDGGLPPRTCPACLPACMTCRASRQARHLSTTSSQALSCYRERHHHVRHPRRTDDGMRPWPLSKWRWVVLWHHWWLAGRADGTASTIRAGAGEKMMWCRRQGEDERAYWGPCSGCLLLLLLNTTCCQSGGERGRSGAWQAGPRLRPRSRALPGTLSQQHIN